FSAVLAHEFGHLARSHGRVSNWIYRQRLRWAGVVTQLEHVQSSGRVLFAPFLNRFVPYFNAYSFPLARANEYESDATSSKLTSARTAAEALTNLAVVSSYLGERFWPRIDAMVQEQATPGFAPFRELPGRIAADVDSSSAQVWLSRVLTDQT